MQALLHAHPLPWAPPPARTHEALPKGHAGEDWLKRQCWGVVSMQAVLHAQLVPWALFLHEQMRPSWKVMQMRFRFAICCSILLWRPSGSARIKNLSAEVLLA